MQQPSNAQLQTPQERAHLWKKGQSGNPRGRPRAQVDIAALAREHGPRCIAVLASLLDDPDAKVRISCAIALLDRGFGKPKQTIDAGPDVQSITFLHLVAARAVGEEIAQERLAIDGVAAPVADATDAAAAPDLTQPALE